MRRVVAFVLMAAGLSLMMVLAGQGLLDSHQTTQEQARLLGEVPQGAAVAKAAPTPTATAVGVGEALLVMRIPRFGADWRWVASEGTTSTVLENGPGHYRGTALPGERGNTAFAAHRAGHGDPFIDFDRLRPGDRVELEQGEVRWVYEIDTEARIIPVTASWVLKPTAGRRLTLTTCWPRYGSSKRMFVRGHLVEG